MAERGWQFWIDRGGTFTDIVARAPNGSFTTAKLLSENPDQYEDAALEGIRRLLGVSAGAPLPADQIASVKMGTTVATNALLERKGARTMLVTNQGFRDLLEIGHQARPRLFDIDIRKPPQLHEKTEIVGARMTADGTELRPLDRGAAKAMFEAARADGFEACAIALIHAWAAPTHEQALAEIAREAGFTQVSASHEVSPLIGLVARAGTSVVDAYLSPVLRRYVDRVAGALGDTKLYFMQSNGGLSDAKTFEGRDAILSGPAGGVVGAARTAEAAGFDRIIGFDMGGTSTDVSLYAGQFERSFESEISGVEIRAPMMAIHTVAAGGGSVLSFDGARFRAGPESAGADPGPAAYRRGGPLTVTDANLVTGKLQPKHFPAVFGPDGDAPLDAEACTAKFDALAGEIEAATGERRDNRDVAEGFLRIAVSNMAQAIKQVTLEKGHDAGDFALQCFGGAGGQHACMVADELGIETVLIHPFAGVLSAYGMGLADQTRLLKQSIEMPFSTTSLAAARERVEALAQEAGEALLAGTSGADGAALRTVQTIELRYTGTDTSLAVDFCDMETIKAAFTQAHDRRFGFATPERDLTITSVSAEAVLPGEPAELPPPEAGGAPGEPIDHVDIWSGGAAHRSPVHEREALVPGQSVDGPALICEATATTIVEPGWRAEMGGGGELRLHRVSRHARRKVSAEGAPDPVMLELFNNAFMALAERMGGVLRNTATSVNIKERLDFSCALFDGDGRLIANAPHVPVHLGAMGESVRSVLKSRAGSLKPGDMIALNNPFNGGTHLPDITVVAPVFDETGETLRFFVANRGHHADIGGITPGSTPPRSTRLEEEGVVIDDFSLVEAGNFREAAFNALLSDAPYPARNPQTNIADIKAQIAANAAGIHEAKALVARYDWPVVEAYMRHVRANAEESVRRVIDRLSDGRFDYELDDGARLCVSVRVDREAREAVIDFTGTDSQRPGNFNAPAAVTRAAVLYVFRCLVEDDLPLNEGCLAPLKLVVPEGSFLSPEPGAAVVAGNTEIGQAVCNALFGALGVAAASQGTMNNFLFGNARHQYYETICGGAGASARADGASAVHTHLTNTRITDPEILEHRYPVRLEAFEVRRGSGGAGLNRGGDGVHREVTVLEPMTVSLVSSSRRSAPFGLQGGMAGAPGCQMVRRKTGREEEIDGIAQVELGAGDTISLETPGGGGYGLPGGRGH